MKLFAFLALGALLGADASRPDQTASAPAPVETRLDVRLNPLADLQLLLRWYLEGSRPADSPPGAFFLNGVFSKAAEELRLLEGQLGGPRAWGLLEGVFASVDSSKALAALAEELPESFRSMDGRDFPLRELGRSLAKVLGSAEPAFLQHDWPRREARLEQEAERLRSGFAGKERDCLAYMLRSLGMEDPKATIPVLLVTEAPWPGAMTHRRRGGGGVCFVGLSANVEGTLLQETVLHEATHALDILDAEKGNVLEELRGLLRKAGIEERDPRFRDAPHTLMFVQAGETVRRVLEPKHVHYGDAAGYYAKFPSLAPAIREAWTGNLDGKVTREAALERIVEAARSAPASRPTGGGF
ncbi:MAG TPA: hypothetical protein VFI25_05140 [Planctomycetota bacterium]|jgi:hypothetical protein|nr:hypothetical protein [Planctomycetota bacterium]